MKKLLLSCAAALALAAPSAARPPQLPKFAPLDFKAPRVERRLLSDGATLYLLPDHELPLVNVTVYIRTGNKYDPPGETGLAELCGTLLRGGGTKTRKPDELDEELESVGAVLETGMDMEMGTASLSVLTKDLDKGLELLADVLMNPRFDEGKLKIEKEKAVEEIRRRNDEPFGIARRELRKMIYGPDHPLSAVPEIADIERIKRKDLVEFHRKYYHPNEIMIAASGDFDPKVFAAKLESAFRGWRPAPVDFPTVPQVDPAGVRAGKRSVGYAEKSVKQASILMGELGVKRHNPDRFKLEVLNEILGGSSFSSRLMRDVRERQGLAYWVGSSFSEPWDYGIIAAGCQTKSSTVGRATESILGEIERIREKPVTPQELKLAKDSLVNSFVFRYASSSAIATQTMSLDYFGYPPDYLDTYTDKIAAVTADDVLEAARKYLKPGSFKIVVVGDEKDFDEPLSKFGSVEKLDIRIPE